MNNWQEELTPLQLHFVEFLASHAQLLKACKRALRELKPTLNDPPAKKRLCLQLGKAIHQAEKVIK